ncbi:MAG: GspH/FimT family pseudopilin [Methylococcales bacterium]|nr:GspH/FimT family pseudopilin [Methylococcales bacterium]
MSAHEKKIYNNQGFTLLELMVTLAIAGIIMVIGIPSFNDTIKNTRLTSNINELVASLNYARSEAVKRNMLVSIKKSATQWESGWNVFTDLNGDGNKGVGDIMLRTYGAVPSSFTLRGSANSLTYQASGMLNGGTAVFFVLCDNSDGNNLPEARSSKLVIVNAVGRAGLGKDSDSNNIPEIEDGTNIISCTSSPFT